MASVWVCHSWAVLRCPLRWQKCKQTAKNNTYYRFPWYHPLITQLTTRFYTDEDCFVNCERYYEEITTIDNGTVTYQQKKIWEFMEEETLPLTLDDIIVNINMIALVSI